MIVRTLDDVFGTEREVHCPSGGFTSYRYLLKRDGMGYSMHKTIIPCGTVSQWHYKHHLESCYCVRGSAKLIAEDSGESWYISEGSMYALDKNDRHTFVAFDETELICVFNPPICGSEVHREDGSYEGGFDGE